MGTKLSASQAAKLVGKSVPTITRAIKKNKLSAEKTEDGGYLIDPAEVLRLWDAVADVETVRKGDIKGHMLGRETPQNSSEIGVLQAKLDAAEARIADMATSMDDMRSTVDDLRTRLDEERADRRAAQARLEDMREKTANIPSAGVSSEAQKSPSGGLFGFFRKAGA